MMNEDVRILFGFLVVKYVI